MSLEQLWRHAGDFAGIVLFPAFGYLMMRRCLGRNESLNNQRAISGDVPFPLNFDAILGWPRIVQRFCVKFYLMCGSWMLLPPVLLWITLLIDAIEPPETSKHVSQYFGAISVLVVPPLAFVLYRRYRRRYGHNHK